ncbi:hypothetical protein OTU49_014494, partial [Cherax quadricarinatus]
MADYLDMWQDIETVLLGDIKFSTSEGATSTFTPTTHPQPPTHPQAHIQRPANPQQHSQLHILPHHSLQHHPPTHLNTPAHPHTPTHPNTPTHSHPPTHPNPPTHSHPPTHINPMAQPHPPTTVTQGVVSSSPGLTAAVGVNVCQPESRTLSPASGDPCPTSSSYPASYNSHLWRVKSEYGEQVVPEASWEYKESSSWSEYYQSSEPSVQYGYFPSTPPYPADLYPPSSSGQPAYPTGLPPMSTNPLLTPPSSPSLMVGQVPAGLNGSLAPNM